MRLPIALQSALDESERQYTQALDHLGLTRQEFDRVAQRIRDTQKTNLPKALPAAQSGRRFWHV
ncbi:MAG: hypothetical protein JRJ87_07885 [Deltaproteobacteria bacterium]|nr:hypothetical protein [Deltaproteobacteria bacterium]